METRHARRQAAAQADAGAAGSVASAAARADRMARPDGSCLALWTNAQVRSTLWHLRNSATPAPVTTSAPAPVRLRSVTDEERERLLTAHTLRMEHLTAAKADPVRDAWVGLIRDRLGTDLTFFTGTYSDAYGLPHGLMLARNVQRDWARFLTDVGLPDTPFVCAVEAHKTGRDVLHLHALVHAPDLALLESAWQADRGFAKAVPCHDGGVAYVCKYALKRGMSDPCAFDWRFRS